MSCGCDGGTYQTQTGALVSDAVSIAEKDAGQDSSIASKENRNRHTHLLEKSSDEILCFIGQIPREINTRWKYKIMRMTTVILS